MPCVKCQSMPFISTKSGDVILSCEVPELCQKLVAFFKEKSIRYSLEDAFTVIVMVDAFKVFLEFLAKTNVLNKLEKSSIRCLFLEPSQSLTPTVLRQMRTLQYYHDVMGANALALLIEKGALTTHFQPNY